MNYVVDVIPCGEGRRPGIMDVIIISYPEVNREKSHDVSRRQNQQSLIIDREIERVSEL